MASQAFLFVIAVTFAWASAAQAGSADHLSSPMAPSIIGGGISTWQKMREAVTAIDKHAPLKALTKNGSHSLTIDRGVSFGGIESYKFQHYYRGVEVIGSMAFHHRAASFTNVLSEVAPFDLEVKPSVSRKSAAALAMAATNGRIVGSPDLKILPSDHGSARLIYWVTVEASGGPGELDGRRDVLVDAHSGEVLAEMPREFTLAPVEVFSAANVPDEDNDKDGAPVQLRFAAMDHVVRSSLVLPQADASARRAAANAEKTLRYFKDRFDRDSYDNEGGMVVNVVHVGRNFANAFWSSAHKIMAYGDGDGERTTDFTHGVDVAGHEMTHGVISEAVRSGSVKGLMYFGESGALNEAFADFFGKMIENEGNWILGKDLFLNEDDKNNGIRNIANPGALKVSFRDEAGEKQEKPYPAHMDEKFIAKGACGRQNDYCWVHVNSTIWSHAAYRVYKEIGREKAEKLFYAVLTHVLTPRSGFSQARKAMKYACGLLYDERTCGRVRESLEAVGL